ncbi:MAG: alpha/beta fold hydrolase [Pirellulaceae bacterium]
MALARTDRFRDLGRMGMLLAFAVCVLTTGCSGKRYLEQRSAPWDPLTQPLRLLSRRGPQPTERTINLLRRYDLVEARKNDLPFVLEKLQQELVHEPALEKIYALAELSYIGAKQARRQGDRERAKQLYAVAVSHAYAFLFDDRPEFVQKRNVYDPQFRFACDLYNQALEGSLRLVDEEQPLLPGQTITTRIGEQEYRVKIELQGPWHNDDVERLEFVSDYSLKDGLSNRHHSFGLGVPMIAIRRPHDGESPAEQYYPSGISFAVTAFLRVHEHADDNDVVCILELIDTVATREVRVANRTVPLESDLTIPLAYFLDTPEFNEQTNTGTLGLLNPNRTEKARGIYMVEPYQSNKVPVVLVHGLWSSPITWMEMFNDLRNFPEIRENYQFWFYLYPTGQTYWLSAAQMRDDLLKLQRDLDPTRSNQSLQSMVLVGHSMGGLVCKLQAIESGDDFWNLVSDQPFRDLNASDEAREKLKQLLFFKPNSAVRRVVTIGTPHRGSNLANQYTRWIGRRVIRLPAMFVKDNERIVRANPGMFRNTELLTVTTSLDSLSPESRVTSVVLNARRAAWIKYHNVIGVAGNGPLTYTDGDEQGDGVVSFASARLPNTTSELVVRSDHLSVHQAPRTILEVRRILLDHLNEMHIAASSDERRQIR